MLKMLKILIYTYICNNNLEKIDCEKLNIYLNKENIIISYIPKKKKKKKKKKKNINK